MCDFHSICVRRDGAKAHIPQNSHSGAIEFHKWRENDEMTQFREPFFVEAEWHGRGAYPGADAITRNSGTMNEKQRKAIDTHYQALALLIADPKTHGEKMCCGVGIFSGDDYGDIRWKVMFSEGCPKRLIAKLAETTFFSDAKPIKSLHPSVKEIDGDLIIAEGFEITAPVLAKAGSVYVREGAAFTAPVLAEVSGSVDVQQGATFTAPVLAKAGSVYVREGATFTAPLLNKKSKGKKP